MISVSSVSMRFGSKVLFEDVTMTFAYIPEKRPQNDVVKAISKEFLTACSGEGQEDWYRYRDGPVSFNATVDRFYRTPFVKKDRINDFLKSLEKLPASQTTQ